MTKKLTPAQSFTLDSRPDLVALVADFRAAALVDSGMVEQIGRAGANLAAKRGALPPRSITS